MSSLTNLQINQSYQGLLKLADSSTGITTNLQNIQDGLGNNTGLKLGTNYLDTPSQLTYQPLTRSNAGVGIAQTGAGTANTNVNKLHGHFFFAKAGESYTGLTISVGTTTVIDSLEFAVYTVGHSTQYGIAPKDLMMSGITIGFGSMGTTGLKTITLPTTLTFTASGVYFLGCLIQSSGTPTLRLRGVSSTASLTTMSTQMAEMYGYVLDQSTIGYINPFMGSTTVTTFVLYGGTDGPFQASYDPATVGASASSFNANTLGFVLRK